jgi:hypothetical protein
MTARNRQAGQVLSPDERYGSGGVVGLLADLLMRQNPLNEGPITRADQIVDALLDAGYSLERQ